jgi:hypothetical protein
MQGGLLEAVEEKVDSQSAKPVHRLCKTCLNENPPEAEWIALCGHRLTKGPLFPREFHTRQLCVVCLDLLETGAMCRGGHPIE